MNVPNRNAWLGGVWVAIPILLLGIVFSLFWGWLNPTGRNWHEAFAPSTWSNWALVLVGIGAIFAALLTLNKIKEQTTATREAAVAATKSVEIAINKERARIRIESADLDFEHGQIVFTVIGYGATEGFIEEGYMNKSITVSPDGDKDLDLGVSASLPDVLVPHTPVQRWIPLEREEIRQVTQGPTAFVHLRVFVRYEDVFNQAIRWEVESRYTWRVTVLSDGMMAWTELTHTSQEKEAKRN